MTARAWSWAWIGTAMALAAAGLIAVALDNGALAARGWLAAFVFVSMFPIGCLALLLVHGITGGRWGEDLAPVLVPAARAIPLLFVLVLPVLVFRSLIYAWPQTGVPEDVARIYMNPAFFDLRAIVAIGIWSALAWSAAWRRPLTAALGLIAHILCLSFIPPDWVLSVQPHSASAAFGFGFGVEEIFAALALAAIMAPQGEGKRANADLSGMMAASLLGTMYFVYVQFVIIWYGNIPDKVEYFVTRTAGHWPAAAAMAAIIGAVVPFLIILNAGARKSPKALRAAGCCAAFGIALHIAWMIAPSLGNALLWPAIAALGLMGLAFFASALRLKRERPDYGRL